MRGESTPRSEESIAFLTKYAKNSFLSTLYYLMIERERERKIVMKINEIGRENWYEETVYQRKREKNRHEEKRNRQREWV
jgi:hypothetical protein